MVEDCDTPGYALLSRQTRQMEQRALMLSQRCGRFTKSILYQRTTRTIL